MPAIASAAIDNTTQNQAARSQETERQAGREERHGAEDGDEQEPVAESVHPRRRLRVRAAGVGDPDGDSRTGDEHRRHVASQDHAELDESLHVHDWGRMRRCLPS